MSLVIRIDVDRPYGRRPFPRHLLSRLGSDLYFPKVAALGFLAELETMLGWLRERRARAYVFFRRCTLPFQRTIEMLDAGGHQVGLHLEDSRSFATFQDEMRIVERHFHRRVLAVSKHGSGGAKFGFRHYPAYEPEKYIGWARQASLHLFLGNLQDPSLEPRKVDQSLLAFPAAFWLETPWRDTRRFTVDWLIERATCQDVVLLVHPENVLVDSILVADFKRLCGTLESKVFE